MPENNEKLSEKVKRLEKELLATRNAIAQCNHSFSPPTPTEKEVRTRQFIRYEDHGSDPEPIYEYIKRIEHGWTRSCDQCGFSEYTAHSKPIIRGSEPDYEAREDFFMTQLV
jgi:hypothetical protein